MLRATADRGLNAAAHQRFPARLPLRSPTFVDHRLSTARECGRRWRPNTNSAWSARFGRYTTPWPGHNCRYRSHARFRATVAIFRRELKPPHVQDRYPLARHHSLRTRDLGAMRARKRSRCIHSLPRAAAASKVHREPSRFVSSGSCVDGAPASSAELA